MRTVVITGGTRGIGRELARRLAGDRVIAVGSGQADLSTMAGTVALAEQLPKVDVLVLGAGRFNPHRVETPDGLEHTFALYVVSRFLLAEKLKPAVILNLCGTGGIRAGAMHWDDLQLRRRYGGFRATMQGARANDLLGVSYAARHPESRYVLYNPLFVNTGLAEPFGQPARSLVKVMATLFAQPVAKAVEPMLALLTDPPARPLTAWRRGKPVDLTRPEFDPVAAQRLHDELTAITGDRGRHCV